MEYRQLGRWGPRVSVLGLGSYLTLGEKTDLATARQMVRQAYEAGINFFDTANGYAAGRAEEVLGACLADLPRSGVFVITKVFVPVGLGPNERGLSAKHIREQCEASLRRLKLDYVDVYMCHRPDPATPLDETIRAMDDLARAGKLLYWGVSAWPAWLMVKAQHLARELGARPLVVNQPLYNLLYRFEEAEDFPVTQSEGIGNVVFSPLAHGLLTGKYPLGQPPPPDSRVADPQQNAVSQLLYWTDENRRRAQALAQLAAEIGTTASCLAIAWCLRHPAVSSVILGARTPAQLTENLKAADLAIPPEAMTRLNEIFPAPGEVLK